MTKTTSEVKNRWNAKAYDRIMFVVKKESALKNRIKDRAAILSMSVNAYLTMLIEKDLDDDNGSSKHGHTSIRRPGE